MMKTVAAMLMLSQAILFCGCATTGYQRASQTRSAINDARTVTADVQLKLGAAACALQNLATNEVANLLPPYQTFSTAVKNLGVAVERLARSDLAVQKRSNAYVMIWQDTLNEYKHADVQKRSAERRGEVVDSFRRLQSEFRAADESLRPLLVSLTDLRRYLGADLTAAGLVSAEEQTRRIAAEVAAAQQVLQLLLADLNRVAGELSPATSPTPGEPATPSAESSATNPPARPLPQQEK